MPRIVPRSLSDPHVCEVTASGVRLEADADWMLDGTEGQLAEIEALLPGRIAKRVTPQCLQLRFGNAVGHYRLPHVGDLEVVTGKWNESHFGWMLADLSQIASALPFSGPSGGALPYDRSMMERGDILYHAFVYLRHVLSDSAPREARLRPALEAIVREPHRRMERKCRSVPLWEARAASPSSLRALVEGRSVFQASRSDLPLAVALRGHLPVEVDQPFVREGFDTPENRFIKTFLEQSLAIIEQMNRLAQSGTVCKTLLADCSWMSHSITTVRRASIWNDVGPMVHFPAASTVLQRRRGYREALKHYLQLRLASILPLDDERRRDLLEIKDISVLYELWCYFKVVESITEALGQPVSGSSKFKQTETQLGVGHGYEVRWPNGVEAHYNLSFSRSKAKRLRTTSVPLRPDIAVWVPKGPNTGFHLLDAKFKRQSHPRLVDAEESFREDIGETRGKATAKHEDLHKMHAYRDAIPLARSVWGLYPGTEMQFFPADGWPQQPDDGLFAGAVNGVGAIPLVPVEEANLYLGTLMQELLGSSPTARAEVASA